MRALIYTRASLDRTGEGKSNDRQHEECMRLCDYKRWSVVGHEADVSISAYGDTARPAWERTLDMIANGEVDVIVAYHLDRLTRNMADLERLILLCEEHGVLVATATGDIDLTNDTGRMVARILAAVARQEVERKAARQRLAHAQRRAEGRPWSAVKALGYERDGTIIPEEADAIRKGIEDVLRHDKSMAAVAREWDELGLTTPHRRNEAQRWSPIGVKKILLNPRNAGLITHKGEVVGPGNWEPIVDESTLTVLTAKLMDPGRLTAGSRNGTRAMNLLTGILRCVTCDKTATAYTMRGKLYYACRARHFVVDRYGADEWVRTAFARTVATVMPGSIGPARTTGAIDGAEAAAEIEELRSRQETLARSFARGFTSEAAFEAAATDISEQIKKLEAGVVTANQEEIDWGSVRADQVAEFMSLDMDGQRKILKACARITAHAAGRGVKNKGVGWQLDMTVLARRGDQSIEIVAHEARVKSKA